MKDKEWFGCMGVLVFGVVLTVINVVLDAWALAILWTWFVVPLFNVPNMGLIDAAGISLIVNFLIREARKTDEEIDWAKTIAKVLVPPLTSVGIGWILMQFV